MRGREVACPACGTKRLCPEASAAPGVVLGDFLILRPITSGGMGEIFVARQLSLDREVALKVLLERSNPSEEDADALLREARAAAKLNHPNIVQAYAVGKEDGVLFFAMEYIRGETCKELLKRKKRLDGMEATKIVLDVARALDAAWREQKIVHQDIKPENIMLDASGFAKLADLGLARCAGSDVDCDSDEVMGTPQYISPEQLTGVPTDVRSDIYSLGATFYHFVTGRFPYVAPTTEEITQMHVDGKLQPPIEVYDHLSVELNRIILKMMARKIEERYQTPKELITDLEAYLLGEAVEVTRSVKVRRPWLRKIKKPLLWGGSALLAIALVLGIVGIIFADSPKIPVFACGFFKLCHQKCVRLSSACRNVWKSDKKQTIAAKPTVVYDGRPEMFQQGNALLERIRGGEFSQALLCDFDSFCRKYPEPQTEKERLLLLEIGSATGKAEELHRMAPMRRKALEKYRENLRRIEQQREAEKRRAAEEARARQAKLKAEKARQEAEARRREAEAQEKARVAAESRAAKIARLDALWQPAAQDLWRDFLICAAAGDKRRFEQALAQFPALPGGIAGADVKERVAYFELFRKELKAMFMDYVLFRVQLKKLSSLGISLSVHPYGICYIVSLSPQRIAHFRTISGVEFDLALDEKHRAETMRFLHVFSSKLKWDRKKSPAAFYYALYTGHLTPDAIEFSPDDFWRKFGEPLKLEIPSP